MTDIWKPSDEILALDAIAEAHIRNPHVAPALTEAGVVLPDEDDETNMAHAAVVLAELDDDESCDESGDVDDDDDVMDDDAKATEA